MITTRMTTHPLANTLDRIGTLNRVLNQALPEGLGSAAPLWVPPLEVAERADAYLIAVDLPGMREEELELGFESNVLTLRVDARDLVIYRGGPRHSFELTTGVSLMR